MTMNLLESVNYSVKHTLFKEKNGNHGNWMLGMKHAGRMISVPFAHYNGADNKTSHDSETYTVFIRLRPKEYYEKNEKLNDC